MKKSLLYSLTLVLTTVQSMAGEQPKTTSELFGVDPRKAGTQAVLGVSESALGAFLAWRALRGPKVTGVTPPTTPSYKIGAANRSVLKRQGVPSTTFSEAFQAQKIAKKNLAELEAFRASTGRGLIKGLALLGSAVLFTDAAGRVYEWKATDAEPTWSPVYSFLKNQERIPVLDRPVPSLKTINTADSAVIPEQDAGDVSLENELRKRLESRLARVNPGARANIENDLKTVQSRIETRKGEIEAAHARQQELRASDHAVNSQNEQDLQSEQRRQTVTGDFFKGHPTADDLTDVRRTLFAGDLLANVVLLKSLFSRDGARAVKAAEEALAAAKALPVASLNKSKVPLPYLGGNPAREEYLKKQAQLVESLRTQIGMLQRSGKPTAELEKQVAHALQASEVLRAGKTVSEGVRNKMVEVAEKTLAETRASALRMSKAAPFLKGVVVVGNALIITDTIGRVIEWNNSSAEPQFSPGITWALMQSEKPAEQVMEALQKYVAEPTSEFFQDAYKKAVENNERAIQSGHEPTFPERGPKF